MKLSQVMEDLGLVCVERGDLLVVDGPSNNGVYEQPWIFDGGRLRIGGETHAIALRRFIRAIVTDETEIEHSAEGLAALDRLRALAPKKVRAVDVLRELVMGTDTLANCCVCDCLASATVGEEPLCEKHTSLHPASAVKPLACADVVRRARKLIARDDAKKAASEGLAGTVGR